MAAGRALHAVAALALLVAGAAAGGAPPADGKRNGRSREGVLARSRLAARGDGSACRGGSCACGGACRAPPPALAAILSFGPTIVKELPERHGLADASSPKKKRGAPSHLLSFYGNDCEMCEYMLAYVKRVEKEAGVKIRRFETWSHPENEKLRSLCDSRAGCGGVPFFYNKETRRWICGATTYDNLKRWATGKPCAPFMPPPTSFKSQEVPKEPGAPMKLINDLKERSKEAMEERQRLAEEQRSASGGRRR